ncbi:glycosyltransferase family 2 protein [Geothermobacter hydrogeniphilus]|uniref:Glycosyltransferase 2-like domain-containing protein n=1 Tax=Geothermobacter hydrogeniphilus TaxID=1969733 RepID=A0A1X0Y1Z3_9BACT|nr:glycosyltransferase family 2 protein [Geothermobacter hydrogeniphilus]ORJ59119.1 hypothetical protein B5V00_11160 [Geothermobacter hydrogeniphilus]
MSNAAKVSFIIVNLNGISLIKECLKSIYCQTYDNYEVIVVDNASDDGSVSWICEHYPDVEIVQLNANHGFAGGNNRGLPFCSGDYIALVNNDVVLEKEWLENVLIPVESDSSVGLVSSRIFVKGTDRIDSIGDRISTAFTGMKLAEGLSGWSFNEPLPVHGVCAAAALYRKSMIDEIGFFDDNLFLNYEDTDLNFRAWLNGWKCRYVPEAIAYHNVNSTIGELSPLSVYYFSRNSLLVLVKNIPLRLILRRLPQRVVYELAAFIYYAIFNRKILAYVCGKYQAFKMLPIMFEKQRAFRDRIKISDNEILSDQYPISRIIIGRILNKSFI